MSIKYNDRGEVVAVNGIVTGHHFGTPMQDACPTKPEDNEAYAIAKNTKTNCGHSVKVWDEQPTNRGGCPDLSQNDPKAPDYVKNRTHYAEVSVIEVLPKNTYTLSKENGLAMAFLDKAPDLVEGHTYTVTWNGTEYTRVCSAFNATYSKSLYIGNSVIMDGGSNTGEPFLIMSTIEGDGAGTGMIVGFAEDTEVTVSITEEGEIVHKLDPKYVSCKIVYGELDNQWLYKDIDLTTYYTRNEIVALGTNFEVSIVDRETKTEIKQFCKPLVVVDEGTHATIHMYCAYKGVADICVRYTDGYTE